MQALASQRTQKSNLHKTQRRAKQTAADHQTLREGDCKLFNLKVELLEDNVAIEDLGIKQNTMIFLEEIGPKLEVANEEEEKVQSPVS